MNLTGVSAYGATLAYLLTALLEKHGHLNGEPADLDALLSAARTATGNSARGLSSVDTAATTAESPLGQAWVMTAPVISTGHLTKATNEMLLEAGDTLNWMSCATYEDGYFISVPDEIVLDELQPPPPDLVDIWAWARSKKFGWVRLDSSGDDIDELPSYDW